MGTAIVKLFWVIVIGIAGGLIFAYKKFQSWKAVKRSKELRKKVELGTLTEDDLPLINSVQFKMTEIEMEKSFSKAILDFQSGDTINYGAGKSFLVSFVQPVTNLKIILGLEMETEDFHLSNTQSRYKIKKLVFLCIEHDLKQRIVFIKSTSYKDNEERSLLRDAAFVLYSMMKKEALK